MIGCGMAIMQVAIYPLLRVAGGEENFAFNTIVAQLVFGAASFLSPFVYSYLVLGLGGDLANGDFLIRLMGSLTPAKLTMGFNLPSFYPDKSRNDDNNISDPFS